LTRRYVVSAIFRARIAIILELSDAQILQPVPLHRVVLREELIDRQAIALAHLLDSDYAAQRLIDFAARHVDWARVLCYGISGMVSLPVCRDNT